MHAAWSRFSFVAVLALASSACATIVRGSRADITFVNAPGDLKAFDEEGQALPLEKQDDGKVSGQLGYKTRELTLTSGSASAKVELDTRVSVGYVVVDFLLYMFPMLIDWGTSKWTNFADVDAKVVLAKSTGSPAQSDPWVAKSNQPEAALRSAGNAIAGAGHALLQPASATPAPPGPDKAMVQAAPRRAPIVASGKLAVLDFKSYTDALKPEDMRYFTDVVRGATLKAAPNLQVMTRENLLVLLQATGKDAASCEGECEVDTGRRIGADVVISGELLKVGSHFKLSLKLHETHDGRLLSTAVGSGATIDELDESAQTAAIDLIAPER